MREWFEGMHTEGSFEICDTKFEIRDSRFYIQINHSNQIKDLITFNLATSTCSK